jgi:hypothetical protein
MTQSRTGKEHRTPLTSADVRSILGEVDDAKVLAILALKPTIADLEMALISLSGDPDIYEAGAPLKGAAGEIVTLLTAEEEEER